MNEVINLMPGAVMPGTATASIGGPPGAVQSTGDALSGVFQELLAQTMGSVDPQMAAVASRAGQQPPEEPSTDQASAEDQGSLLGSTENAPSTLGAAQAVAATPEFLPVVESTPQVQATEPASEVEAIAVETVTSPDQQAAPNLAVDNTVSMQADASDTVAVSQDQQTAQPVVDSVPDVQAPSPNDAPQVVVKAAVPEVKAAHVKASHEPKHTTHAPEAHAEKHARVSEAMDDDNLALPETPAPSVPEPTFDYSSLRLKFKLDVDVNPNDQVRIKESIKLFASAPNGQAANAATGEPATPQEKIAIAKTAIIPQTAEVSSDTRIAIAAEQPMENNSQDTPQEKDSNAPWAASGLRPSFERSVAGAENSQGFHAPERIIEAKVIHQIVQSAKLQLIDGGANMTLRLDPPHLGTLNMSVSVQEGAVVANIQTSTQTAMHVLQTDLSSLKQALSDAGIVVDSINVSLGSTPDQASTPFSGHHADHQNNGRHVGSRFMEDSPSEIPEPPVSGTQTQQAAGVLDYLA